MSGFWKMKEPVNTWTHFIPFIAAIVGLIVIISKTWGDPAKLITMSIYGLTVILLFGMSSFYHWLKLSPKKEVLMRKLDHMAIYLLIAGSYTPVLFYGLQGMWRGVMLTLIWVLALLGIIMKIWFINAPRKLSTALYVILGWIAVIPFYQLVHTFSTGAILLMVLGGVAYTIGAVIYGTKRLDFFPEKFGFHEIFHLFVALGGVLHFLMMVIYVLPM